MARYALIQNDYVVDIRELSDEEYPDVAMCHQGMAPIDEATQTPKVGWVILASGRAIPPPVYDPVQYAIDMIALPAMAFGERIKDMFIAENILMGITLAQRTKDVGLAMKDMMFWLASGSVYEALAAAEEIALDPELEPFITAERIRKYKNLIRNYVRLPPV